MDTTGYATIKKDAKSHIAKMAKSPEKFLGEDVRVLEFAKDGGVLCVSRDATEVAMFDKEDILRCFKCSVLGDVITPPDMDFLTQTAYSSCVLSRIGGYGRIMRDMVIQGSLMKGVFSDEFLWALQSPALKNMVMEIKNKGVTDIKKNTP